MSLQEIESLRARYNTNIILAVICFGIGFFLNFTIITPIISIGFVIYLLLRNETNKTAIKRWVVENKISIENLTNLTYLTKDEYYKANTVFFIKELALSRKNHAGLHIDDVIIGQYKHKDIEIIEFKYSTDSEKSQNRPSYICMATSNPDQIEGQTVAYSKNSWKFDLPEKIRTESVVFEKIFHTFSTDQIQARLHLKTNVMQDMIDFQSSLQSGETVFFFDGSMMYVIFKVFHNPFEVNMYKPIEYTITNPQFLIDFQFVLKIFDDFWLNRKVQKNTSTNSQILQ